MARCRPPVQAVRCVAWPILGASLSGVNRRLKRDMRNPELVMGTEPRAAGGGGQRRRQGEENLVLNMTDLTIKTALSPTLPLEPTKVTATGAGPTAPTQPVGQWDTQCAASTGSQGGIKMSL